jgi:Superinfection immunity protein
VELIIIVPLFLFIYFIPTQVAQNRKHIDTLPIFLTNLFLGWTFLGWVVALIWATTK